MYIPCISTTFLTKIYQVTAITCRTQWLRGGTGSNPVLQCLNLGQVFSLYIAPVHSAV